MNFTIYTGRKSATCKGKVSGKPLTEFTSRHEAMRAAEDANLQIGNNFKPYKCSTCKKWHLSPAERVTPSSICRSCRGADGKLKDLYQSEISAQKRAEIISEEKGVHLQVYKCGYSNGWHLTKG